MSKLSVGGQAVVEGVMMRSPQAFTVVVRAADGSLVVRQQPWLSLSERYKWLKWPFFRGGVVLLESLHNGFSALNFSASVQEGRDLKQEKPGAWWMTILVAVVMALALFAALPHFLTWGLGALLGSEVLQGGTGAGFHLVDGLIKLILLISYLWLISRLPEIARVFQYHGAEHKAIYTFEAGEQLTVANARKQGRFHPRCGTSFLLVVVLVAVLLFSLAFSWISAPGIPKIVLHSLLIVAKLALLFPVAGLSYEFIRLAGDHPKNRFLKTFVLPGLWTQRISTKEPDDSQLEVALASLISALKMEEMAGKGTTPTETQGRFESFDAYMATLEGNHVPEAEGC